MRQDQAMTIAYLFKAGLRPSSTARKPEREEMDLLADRARMNAAIEGGLGDVALALADLLYSVNALAAMNGIDLEPFLDHVHVQRMGERADADQLDADAALMASVSEKDQIARLLDRADLDATERGQVETCAHLHRAGIALRWPQRVALARIEAVAEARARQSARAAA